MRIPKRFRMVEGFNTRTPMDMHDEYVLNKPPYVWTSLPGSLEEAISFEELVRRVQHACADGYKPGRTEIAFNLVLLIQAGLTVIE